MDPIEFKESNTTYAKDQPEYRPLPCLKAADGTLLICWKGTWRDRLRFLFHGVIWHTVSTFGQKLQPQMIVTVKPEITYQEVTVDGDEPTSEIPNPSYKIPIAGLNRAEVLAALFNAAKVDPSNVASKKPMSVEQAKDYLNALSEIPGRNQYVDEIDGRIIRCHFGREHIRPQQYDHANGPNRAILALIPLLPENEALKSRLAALL